MIISLLQHQPQRFSQSSPHCRKWQVPQSFPLLMRQLKPLSQEEASEHSPWVEYWWRQERAQDQKALSRQPQLFQACQTAVTARVLIMRDTGPFPPHNYLFTFCHSACYCSVSTEWRVKETLASLWMDHYSFYLFCLEKSARQKLGRIVAHSLQCPLTSANTDIKPEECCWLEHSYCHCTGVHLRSESNSICLPKTAKYYERMANRSYPHPLSCGCSAEKQMF